MKKQLAFIILRKDLSDNKKTNNIIFMEYLKTNTCQTNLKIILLSLFVL